MTSTAILFIVMWLFVLHFIADFPLQSREMGLNKSKYFNVLAKHIAIHAFVFWLGMIPLIFIGLGAYQLFVMISVICLSHGIIDWNIWRGYKWLKLSHLVA